MLALFTSSRGVELKESFASILGKDGLVLQMRLDAYNMSKALCLMPVKANHVEALALDGLPAKHISSSGSMVAARRQACARVCG